MVSPKRMRKEQEYNTSPGNRKNTFFINLEIKPCYV